MSPNEKVTVPINLIASCATFSRKVCDFLDGSSLSSQGNFKRLAHLCAKHSTTEQCVVNLEIVVLSEVLWCIRTLEITLQLFTY